jgi:hypothetical protein
MAARTHPGGTFAAVAVLREAALTWPCPRTR